MDTQQLRMNLWLATQIGRPEVGGARSMRLDYVLWDLDTGRAWNFEDVQEARAIAEQKGFRHWSIMHGDKLVDQYHKNGRFIDVRERYAEVMQALDSVPRDQVVNLIHLWVTLHALKGDMIEELEKEGPLVWMRATDLGEEDE